MVSLNEVLETKKETVSPCEMLSSERKDVRRRKSHHRSFTFHAALSNFRPVLARSISPSVLMVCLIPNYHSCLHDLLQKRLQLVKVRERKGVRSEM